MNEIQSSCVEMGEPSVQHSTNQAFMAEWPDGRQTEAIRH